MPEVSALPQLGVYLATISEASSERPVQECRDEDTQLLLAGQRAGDAAMRFGATDSAAWCERLRVDEAGALAALNGFFAGVFVDQPSCRALLLTDRYGIERLYACDTADGLYFASEAKALLRVLPQTRGFDPDGIAEYCAFGCTLPPRTLFRNIYVLPQAARWAWDGHRWDRRRYFDSAEWESQEALSSAEFERTYAETLSDVLASSFADAGRVGLALTGGLDTRMILSARPADWNDPITYTYSGASDTRDVTLARALAHACDLPHEVIRLGDSFLRDFPGHADKTVRRTDGAHGVTGTHESVLSERASRLAPVRMTGIFGGEILRGLSPWRHVRLRRNLLAHELEVATDEQHKVPRPAHAVTAAAFGTTPAAMHGTLSSCRAWLDLRTPFLDARLVRLAYRAPGSAATEQSAVRMLRRHLPLLPALPTDRGRQVGGPRVLEYGVRSFEQVAFKLDYIANESLAWPFTALDPIVGRLARSRRVLGRHKYLAYRRWFRHELATYVQDLVRAASRLPIWQGAALRRLAADHISGADNVTEDVNLVLTLEAVDRLLLREQATAASEDLAPLAATGASR